MSRELSPDLVALVRAFRPGHRLSPVPNRAGRWFVVRDGSSGRVAASMVAEDPLVRNPDGSPIVLGKHESPSSLRRVRSQLEAAGVVPRIEHRRSHERTMPRPESEHNPLVAAREVLADPGSTHRERGLAKEVLRLSSTNSALRRLAKRLGEALSERQREREEVK